MNDEDTGPRLLLKGGAQRNKWYRHRRQKLPCAAVRPSNRIATFSLYALITKHALLCRAAEEFVRAEL